MYAIVKSGGKQYRVERGQRLLVERLATPEGKDVALEPVLYRSDEVVFDKSQLEQVTVTAKVVAHVRGEKLRVFKFKPKRGYKRRTGHRQDLTQIEVTEIALGKAKAASKAAAAAPADAPAKPRTTKPAGDKPATAKAAAETAPAEKAARKPAAAKPRATKPAPAKRTSAKPAKAQEEPADGS
jgi:large subunit ribosomal protein L21